MEIKEQSGLRAVLQDVEIPQVYVVRQHFERDGIPDIPAYLHEKLNRGDLKSRIRPGMKVVLTGSSRQIANMPVILRELARFVKDQGGEPYIIPAMGSHGGATAEGQREILESYGITEDFCGCPIFSSMETVQVGTMACGEGGGEQPHGGEEGAGEAEGLLLPLLLQILGEHRNEAGGDGAGK